MSESNELLARTPDEVVYAHDLFTAILLGKVQINVDDEDLRWVHASADAMCWVLGHAHNKAFEMNLASLKRAVEEAGYVVSKVPYFTSDPSERLMNDGGEVTVSEQQVMVAPPPEYLCQTCSTTHDPKLPHNLMSVYYHLVFQVANGRVPTWEDAWSHCSPETVESWKKALVVVETQPNSEEDSSVEEE